MLITTNLGYLGSWNNDHIFWRKKYIVGQSIKWYSAHSLGWSNMAPMSPKRILKVDIFPQGHRIVVEFLENKCLFQILG